MPGSGIILTTINPSNNKVYFLLQYVFDRQHLEDFGGIKEPNQTFLETAIKEFIEETNNILRISPKKIKDIIKKDGIKLTTKDNRYFTYLVPVSSNYYLNYKSKDFGEKEMFENIRRVCMWLTVEDILQFEIHPRCKPFLDLVKLN
jgi:hypothetical protein